MTSLAGNIASRDEFVQEKPSWLSRTAHVIPAFAICLLVCHWFVTWGTWRLFEPDVFGGYYDAQARAIVHISRSDHVGQHVCPDVQLLPDLLPGAFEGALACRCRLVSVSLVPFQTDRRRGSDAGACGNICGSKHPISPLAFQPRTQPRA